MREREREEGGRRGENEREKGLRRANERGEEVVSGW